jgi:ribonuclease G
MSKEIYISSTPHETRLAIVEKDELTEIYYERENEYTLAGSIYNGRVTRVLPGMQSSFVDIGLERDAFLYITDFMEEAGDSADFESTKDASRPQGGGNRDRGDRGRNRREDRPRAPQAEAAPDAAPVQEEAFEPIPHVADSEAVGEGAPGADGNRRWSGRRGRRRGRGGNGAPVNGESPNETPSEIEAPEAVSEEFTAAPEPQRERSDRGDRGERRRGGRDQRDSRHNAIRERFAPRGLRNDAGEAESVDVDASTPSPEPFILPGESLSKYRRNEDGTAANSAPQTSAASANVLVPKPSTEVAPLVGWDGGSVLPGETLSRHRDRGSDSSNERSSPDRGDRGRDRRRDRDGRRDDRSSTSEPKQEFHQEFKPQVQLEPSEAVLPPVSSGHDTEELEQPVEWMYQGPAETVEEAQEPIAEFHETTTEYEPEEDASASYRVDPAGPSEFRQVSAVEEFPVEEVIEAHEEAVAAAATTEVEPPVEHHAEPETEQPAQDSNTFAPGDGRLEEEILDDDEVEIGAMHASAIDDDTEEETIDHPAELGRMLRDLSIDEITSSHIVDHAEDEVDFDMDEDDLEEDELESTEEDHFEGDEVSGSDISETEEEEFAEAGSVETDEAAKPATERAPREGGRRGRRDGRRGGRDRERSSSSDRGPERNGERSSSSGSRDRRGMAGSRSGDRRGGRPSVQASDLPAISDLLKPGQEVLVQIAKEPIAKKGARITSHIALPGRFLVFMPTVNHVGVSRKIESDGERRRLKEILLSEKGEASGGFIVRTAASGASEEELRSDLRFLLNLWTDIKTRSESSKSPALIYHDLNLIERILRDQVTDNFSAIWVDTEAEYERVLRFLQRFQPSLIRRVKLYGKDTPLFEQFGINAEIDKALRSKVWLKSGGSIVINQTEALVAIDINTGKFVGKTARLEDTIVKTNLDAIPEIVRQIRLRDLGGIIIIDFIDMEERKNRNRVMAALEEELKSDRAPSKVLQFNDFGLVAITRKRVKQSLERTLSTTCAICQGTGMTKSPVTVCNDIYIEMRKMHKVIEKGDIMLRVHPEVVKQLKSNGGKWLQEMEDLSRKTILVKSDPTLHPEQFDIH